MVLSREKVGQIALRVLQQKMELDGIRLNPKELKREIHNEAKKFGITPQELAEFAKLIYKTAFDKTMTELDLISPPAQVAVNPDNT
jgi:hypothetical protein